MTTRTGATVACDGCGQIVSGHPHETPEFFRKRLAAVGWATHRLPEGMSNERDSCPSCRAEVLADLTSREPLRGNE